MQASVLFYLLESSIRKYIISAAAFILIKYIPLYAFLVRHAPKKNIYFLHLSVGLPLLATVPSFDQVPYAIFDFNATFIVPIVCLLVIPEILLTQVAALRILYFGLAGGVFNSLFITAQAILGPTHWLSQTVDQSFSQHVYGVGAELQKAPGIASQSSPFITVAGLIALSFLLKNGNLSLRASLLVGFVVTLSVVFNLQSRTYVLGILVYLFIQYMFLPMLSRKNIGSAIVVSSTFLLLTCIAYYLVAFYLPHFVETNRTVNDMDSVTDRILSFYPLDQASLSLPMIGGLGLGSTVNNNPYTINAILPPQCLGIFIEWEFPRLVCAFGWYAYFLIIMRIGAAFFLVKRAINLMKKNPTAVCEATAYLFISFNVMLGAQFKTNDIAAGLLLVSIVGRASAFPFVRQSRYSLTALKSHMLKKPLSPSQVSPSQGQ